MSNTRRRVIIHPCCGSKMRIHRVSCGCTPLPRIRKRTPHRSYPEQFGFKDRFGTFRFALTEFEDVRDRHRHGACELEIARELVAPLSHVGFAIRCPSYLDYLQTVRHAAKREPLP